MIMKKCSTKSSFKSDNLPPAIVYASVIVIDVNLFKFDGKGHPGACFVSNKNIGFPK